MTYKTRWVLSTTLLLVLTSGLLWVFLKPSPTITQKPPKKTQPVLLQQANFKQIPGWNTNHNYRLSLKTFQLSCKVFLKQDPSTAIGTPLIPLTVHDMLKPCQSALKISSKNTTNQQAKQFFETWFTAVIPYQKQAMKGLFTGYYMPLLLGSLVKTDQYAIPIYATPDNLLSIELGLFNPSWQGKHLMARVEGQKVLPYYTRKQINHGAIEHHAPVIAWTTSPIERLNLEIQGSGVVKFPNGESLYLGYAAANGAPYTPIGRVMINKGIFTRDTASMPAIRSYLKSHPQQVDLIIDQNKSFVFFKKLEEKIALGAQGIGLTPGYSLAVDPRWIPLGLPIWLSTTHPDPQKPSHKPLHRLMIAQDTGGAIRGVVRGDVYWGEGARAESIAGNMRNKGYYWILVPKHINIPSFSSE